MRLLKWMGAVECPPVAMVNAGTAARRPSNWSDKETEEAAVPEEAAEVVITLDR
jgi:hypothetical protein